MTGTPACTPPDPLARIDTAMDNLRAAIGMAIASAKMPNDQNTPPLHELIKARRKVIGLSLEDVARDAHCTKSHIWELESDRSRNPTIAMVWMLSRALGMPFQVVAASALVTAMKDRPGVF